MYSRTADRTSATLSVGGNLNLEGCTGITALPWELFTWSLGRDGCKHEVYLAGSGLLGNGVEEWLNEVDAPNLRFHVSMDGDENEKTTAKFKDLEDVTLFWFNAAGVEMKGGKGKIFRPKNQSQERDLFLFLGRLTGSKDYLGSETRLGLATQVVELLDFLSSNTDDALEQQVLIRTADSLDACNDKPVWALNQMNMVVLIQEARGSREKLEKLGKRILCLQIVQEHARKKCVKVVDDVCVYLKFETSLREELDLPVTARTMHFPSYIKVTEQEIDAARQECLNLSKDDVLDFLESWTEWQRQERYEASQFFLFEDVQCFGHGDEKKSKQEKSLPEKRKSWFSKRISKSRKKLSQSFRNLLGEKTTDAVFFKTQPSQKWSFHDLMTHWVETGRDLLNGQSWQIQELKEALRR